MKVLPVPVAPKRVCLLIPLLKYFKQEMPEIFDDVEYDEDFNPEYYAKMSIEEEV